MRGDFTYRDHKRILKRIIRAYDSPIVRAYTFVRFIIININILHILGLCMRGKRRILELGCGFGLFGCYFALRNPDIEYHGIDINRRRTDMARTAAIRLGLKNVHFECGDARGRLPLREEYDAALMLDLLHHVPDAEKQHILQMVLPRIHPQGSLVIKEITRRPAWKLFFTWALDVIMTRGFDMWYWEPEQFRSALGDGFQMEAYPIADWLPYPHIVYLFSRDVASGFETPKRSETRRIPLQRNIF